MTATEPQMQPVPVISHAQYETEDAQLTDVGNAARLVKRHGQHLRYVKGWGWMVYDGKRWQQDDTGQVMEKAKDTIRAIRFDAAAEANSDRREKLWKHALSSEYVQRLEAMVKLARSVKGIAATPDDFDKDPLLLNVQNGTLNLETGERRDHDPADMLTHLCPVGYVPEARSERWDAFLMETADYDPDLKDWFQCAAGYSLTGLVGEKCFFMCYGPGGDNGKTTYLEALKYVLGDYATTLSPDSLKVGGGGAIRNDLAALTGKRLVISSEPKEGLRLSMDLVKSLTGNDSMSVRFLNKEFFEFKPQLKLWLATNATPDMSETGRAALARMRLVPFDNKPPVLDKTLQATLRQPEHAQAILAWAVEGARRYLRDGTLPTVARIEEAIQDYRGDQSPFSAFLQDCTVEDPKGWEKSVDVLRVYNSWAGKNDAPALTSATAVNKEAEKHGHKKKRRTEGMGLLGLRLKDDHRPSSPAQAPAHTPYAVFDAAAYQDIDDLPF